MRSVALETHIIGRGPIVNESTPHVTGYGLLQESCSCLDVEDQFTWDVIEGRGHCEYIGSLNGITEISSSSSTFLLLPFLMVGMWKMRSSIMYRVRSLHYHREVSDFGDHGYKKKKDY